MRIGVDLGGTKIEALALDEAGDERCRRRIPTPVAAGYEAIVEAVATLVRTLEGELGATASVGVGTPGALSPATGRLKNANTVCLNGRPLDHDLSTALGRPVRIANDADCFALSEATDGAGAAAPVIFGVIAGTGTGGGVVVNGALLRGPNAITGEWGHNPLPWPRDEERPGPACYCGKRGCLETWLSGPGLAADHARVTGEALEAPAIAARAARGDAGARATLDRHADRFARGLATVIDVLDPHVVVLGGGLSKLSHLAAAIRARLPEHVFSDRVDTRVEVAAHGDSSGVRGAAWLSEGAPRRSTDG
ncbi:MAG TPA: ROK family protein [Sandaracinaceae bacterium LLY-WYZ-13_1]|nr:ROK family protein [Sandaracinaceae bacterium LLY-WYZ-13_1]